MKVLITANMLGIAIAVASLAGAPYAGAASTDLNAELRAIQHEWATANFNTQGKKERRAAFEAVAEHAAAFAHDFPNAVEAIAWEGIVLSSYAGEVSAMSAMKYAKAALASLQRAESMAAEALAGGIYASLGALYSKVPGGFIGFGDDQIAEDYFVKALAVDAGNIDNNFFYGEYLAEHGRYEEALNLLQHALDSPTVIERPVFDAGRRSEIRTLIGTVQAKIR